MPDENLYDEKQAAKLLCVPHRTLQTWRQTGRGPQYLKLGALVRYRPSDVDAYLTANARASTSAEVA